MRWPPRCQYCGHEASPGDELVMSLSHVAWHCADVEKCKARMPRDTVVDGKPVSDEPR